MRKFFIFAVLLALFSGCVQEAPSGPDCEGRALDAWWREGCNECICYSDGNSSCRDICVQGCGTHKLGDRWRYPDGCNTCACTINGESCTEIICYPKSKCTAAGDCELAGLVHAQCVGQWECIGGKCAWECETPPVCGEHRYSGCPEGCVKTCVPSKCSFSVPLGTNLCTDDCEGEGSCAAPS